MSFPNHWPSLTCCRLLTLLPFVCFLHAQADPAASRLLLDAAFSGEAIIAVGERGTIIRSEDHGRSWNRMQTPDSATLTGVAFSEDGVSGWAVGHGASILASKDRGKTWTRAYQGPKADQAFLDVAVIDQTRIIAVGAYGLCVLSSDGGKTWLAANPQDSDLHYNKIAGGLGSTLWLVGEQGTLLRSSDSARSWEKRTVGYDGSLFGFLSLKEGACLCFGLRGHAFLCGSDNAATWEKIPTGTSGLIATGLQLKDGTIVLAGQSRLFLLSHDGGKTFSVWKQELTTAVAELLQARNGSLLAFGEAGVSRLPSPPARRTGTSN